MLSLGLPYWQLAHFFCILSSILLATSGFVGFVMTGMILDFNGAGLVALAWATCGVVSSHAYSHDYFNVMKA